jgi:hypothetical protein
MNLTMTEVDEEMTLMTPSELKEMRGLTAELIREISDLYMLMAKDPKISVASFAIVCEYLHAEHGLDYMSASRLVEKFPEMLLMTDRLRKEPQRGGDRT